MTDIGMGAAVAYLEGVAADDVVLVVHHWDMDGSAAASIVSRVLEEVRGRGADRVVLPQGRKHRIDGRVEQLIESADVTHLVVLDMGLSAERAATFAGMGVDILNVDHHTFDEAPGDAVFVNPRLNDPEAYVPAAKLCHDIAQEFGLDLAWIAGLGVIQDFAVAGHESLFEPLQEKYPQYFPREIEQHALAKECRYGTYSSILNIKPYKDADRCAEHAHQALTAADDLTELEMQDGFARLQEEQQAMEREIERILANFDEEKQVFEEERLIFFVFDSDYHINSSIATQISLEREDWIHVIVNQHRGTANVSARCQSGRIDLGAVLKTALPDDEGEAGGHRKAAGASFPADRIDAFQENLRTTLQN